MKYVIIKDTEINKESTIPIDAKDFPQSLISKNGNYFYVVSVIDKKTQSISTITVAFLKEVKEFNSGTEVWTIKGKEIGIQR